jgi:phospholipid/cholesterol/gamma-HCH transport system substrate-binding protein
MEMKVGALILASVVLLVAFVVVMGGLSLQPTYRILVDFDNPGGLQSGAPVRIAGARVGRITAIEFRGGQKDKQGKSVKPIRVIAAIDAEHQKAIHDDAIFFVAVQGLLGEMHLAIDPGSPERPLLKDGAVVTAISPPRLDQLLGESYELLHRTYLGLVRNEQKIAETFDGLHRTLRVTGTLLEKHESDISSLVVRFDRIAAETEETLAAAREQYVDGERINRIMGRVDRITATVDEHLDPLLTDTRTVLADTKVLTNFLASDEQMQTYRTLSAGSRQLVVTAEAAAQDAREIVAHVKAGKGTAGAIVMDEALYDDLQELVRDLKTNPWKILWKQ